MLRMKIGDFSCDVDPVKAVLETLDNHLLREFVYKLVDAVSNQAERCDLDWKLQNNGKTN